MRQEGALDRKKGGTHTHTHILSQVGPCKGPEGRGKKCVHTPTHTLTLSLFFSTRTKLNNNTTKQKQEERERGSLFPHRHSSSSCSSPHPTPFFWLLSIPLVLPHHHPMTTMDGDDSPSERTGSHFCSDVQRRALACSLRAHASLIGVCHTQHTEHNTHTEVVCRCAASIRTERRLAHTHTHTGSSTTLRPRGLLFRALCDGEGEGRQRRWSWGKARMRACLPPSLPPTTTTLTPPFFPSPFHTHKKKRQPMMMTDPSHD